MRNIRIPQGYHLRLEVEYCLVNLLYPMKNNCKYFLWHPQYVNLAPYLDHLSCKLTCHKGGSMREGVFAKILEVEKTCIL